MSDDERVTAGQVIAMTLRFVALDKGTTAAEVASCPPAAIRLARILAWARATGLLPDPPPMGRDHRHPAEDPRGHVQQNAFWWFYSGRSLVLDARRQALLQGFGLDLAIGGSEPLQALVQHLWKLRIALHAPLADFDVYLEGPHGAVLRAIQLPHRWAQQAWTATEPQRVTTERVLAALLDPSGEGVPVTELRTHGWDGRDLEESDRSWVE